MAHHRHLARLQITAAIGGIPDILGEVGQKCLLSGVEQTHLAVAENGKFDPQETLAMTDIAADYHRY